MVRVFRSANLLAVHHAKNLLEAEGIACRLRNEHLASAMGEIPMLECDIELWIANETDESRALAALRRRAAAPRGTPWQCGACGERGEPQFAQCWRCGTDRSD